MNETYRAGLRPDGRNLWVEGYKFDMPVKRFWSGELTEDAWHNLGINLDYDAKYVSARSCCVLPSLVLVEASSE